MTPHHLGGDRTMRLDCVIALSIASTLALAGTALAQQPAPSPAPPSGPPADYGAPISNEQAKAVASAATSERKLIERLAFRGLAASAHRSINYARAVTTADAVPYNVGTIDTRKRFLITI